MLVLHCDSSESYLIRYIVPEALHIDLRDLRAKRLVEKSHSVLVHVDCTYVRELAENLLGSDLCSRIRWPPSVNRERLQSDLRAFGLPSVSDEEDRATRYIAKSKTNSFGNPDNKIHETFGDSIYPYQQAKFPTSEYFIVDRDQYDAESCYSESIYFEPYISNSFGFSARIYQFKQRYLVCLRQSDEEIKRNYRSPDGTNIVCTRNEIQNTRHYSNNPLSFLICAAKQSLTVADNYNIEFAAYDYVFNEALRPYLIDLNFTPWWGDVRQCDTDWIVDCLNPCYLAN